MGLEARISIMRGVKRVESKRTLTSLSSAQDRTRERIQGPVSIKRYESL